MLFNVHHQQLIFNKENEVIIYSIAAFVMTKCVHKEDIKFFCMNVNC